MKRTLLVLMLPALVVGCHRVPITGRKQVNLLSETEMMGMSLSQYQAFIQENPPLPDGDSRVRQVRTIGERLARAATEYLTEHHAADRPPDHVGAEPERRRDQHGDAQADALQAE